MHEPWALAGIGVLREFTQVGAHVPEALAVRVDQTVDDMNTRTLGSDLFHPIQYLAPKGWEGTWICERGTSNSATGHGHNAPKYVWMADYLSETPRMDRYMGTLNRTQYFLREKGYFETLLNFLLWA